MLERRLVLPHLLAERAAETPDRLAMLDVEGRRATYREVHATNLLWADAYRRLGVEADEPVATMLPNSFESYHAWLGVAWLRAIEVPANNMYRGDTLRYLVEDSSARLLVISRRFVDRLADVAAGMSRLETVVVPDAADATEVPALPFDVLTGPAFFDGATPADDLDGPGYNDVAAMIYTSGTTGPSKGVLMPWGELYQFVRLPPEGMLDPDRGYYTVFPAFHVSGKSSLYMSARYHGHLVIRETFSLAEFWNDIRAHDVQAAGLIGTLAALLLLQPEAAEDADSPLEHVFIGPLPPDVDAFKRRFGVDVGTGFGMTEIGVPLGSDGFDLPNSTSCGRAAPAHPHYEVKVADELDEDVGPGAVGELLVPARDPWVMSLGYWGRPEQTAAAWRNGWFHTGDAFRYDEDGNFYFVDRIKDAIRRRGENVSSFEVEAAVNQHPAVQECAAVAVPSELSEDDIKIVVVATPGQAVDPAELIEFLVPRMPRFMIPRYVEVVDALPKTDASFRVRKVELRTSRPGVETWDREAAGVVVPRD